MNVRIPAESPVGFTPLGAPLYATFISGERIDAARTKTSVTEPTRFAKDQATNRLYVLDVDSGDWLYVRNEGGKSVLLDKAA